MSGGGGSHLLVDVMVNNFFTCVGPIVVLSIALVSWSYVGEGNDGLGDGSGFLHFRSQDRVCTMYSNNSTVSQIFSN